MKSFTTYIMPKANNHSYYAVTDNENLLNDLYLATLMLITDLINLSHGSVCLSNSIYYAHVDAEWIENTYKGVFHK